MARPPRDFQGNRIWLVETEDGLVLQKLYNARRVGLWGSVRHGARCLLTVASGRKTSPSARGRWATERRLLDHWARAGFDVPADLTGRHPALAGPRILVIEHVEGPSMLELLRRRTGLPRLRRDELLERFAAVWRRRHDTALSRDDPELIQEHGSFAHVLVSGERFVTIDLEQAFSRRARTGHLVAKEIGAYLRSLAVCTDPDVFRDDLRTLVSAYGDAWRLTGVVEHYLSHRPTTRFAQRVERLWHKGSGRLERKYHVLGELARVLDERVGTASPM